MYPRLKMHQQGLNLNQRQIQQLLQLQLQQQQQQQQRVQQQLHQQNNRAQQAQIQIFAQPPNTNRLAPNVTNVNLNGNVNSVNSNNPGGNVTGPSSNSNGTALFQIQTQSPQRNGNAVVNSNGSITTTSQQQSQTQQHNGQFHGNQGGGNGVNSNGMDSSNGTAVSNGHTNNAQGIQRFQSLQILQMARSNGNGVAQNGHNQQHNARTHNINVNALNTNPNANTINVNTNNNGGGGGANNISVTPITPQQQRNLLQQQLRNNRNTISLNNVAINGQNLNRIALQQILRQQQLRQQQQQQQQQQQVMQTQQSLMNSVNGVTTNASNGGTNNAMNTVTMNGNGSINTNPPGNGPNGAPSNGNIGGQSSGGNASIGNVSSVNVGGGGNGRGGSPLLNQSIEQQMIAFIQQLRQFPPLFNHLQQNPQVLAQLLQQFKWKQEQTQRDRQRRAAITAERLGQQTANVGFGNLNNVNPNNNANPNANNGGNGTVSNQQTIRALLRSMQQQQQQQQPNDNQQTSPSLNNHGPRSSPINMNGNNNLNVNVANQNNLGGNLLPALENENGSTPGGGGNNNNNNNNNGGNSGNASMNGPGSGSSGNTQNSSGNGNGNGNGNGVNGSNTSNVNGMNGVGGNSNNGVNARNSNVTSVNLNGSSNGSNVGNVGGGGNGMGGLLHGVQSRSNGNVNIGAGNGSGGNSPGLATNEVIILHDNDHDVNVGEEMKVPPSVAQGNPPNKNMTAIGNVSSTNSLPPVTNTGNSNIDTDNNLNLNNIPPSTASVGSNVAANSVGNSDRGSSTGAGSLGIGGVSGVSGVGAVNVNVNINTNVNANGTTGTLSGSGSIGNVNPNHHQKGLNGNGSVGTTVQNMDAHSNTLTSTPGPVDINMMMTHEMGQNQNVNGVASSSTNSSGPKLDFSQLKTIKLNLDPSNNNDTNTPGGGGSGGGESRRTGSQLKRSYSDTDEGGMASLGLQSSKRRRLNDKTITIPSSSDDNEENDANYVPGEDTSTSRRRKKKKKRRSKKTRSIEESDDFYDDLSASTERVERVTRSTTRRRQKEEEQGRPGPSFSELVDQATQSGDNAQISDEDPLISQIAQKMSQIRQINQRKQVGTPPVTAPVRGGLDALLMAIEADQPRERSLSKSKSPRVAPRVLHGAKTTEKQEYHSFDDHSTSSQPEMQRKHGELFVVRNGNGTNIKADDGYNNGDHKETETDLRVQKIQQILGNEYTDCFVVNEQSTFLKYANDETLKPDLQRLASQLRRCYHNGLVQVFKTLTDDVFKDKWMQCNGAGKLKYFNIWNEVSPHVVAPMDEWLKHFEIKNAMALIFAIMDHLFSHSMFKHLCGVTKNLRGMDLDDRKELDSDQRGQFRREKWLPVSGNPLFKEIELNKELIREIENTQIHWLFGYWKKVLLQSAEPLKCLARSYLVNSPPNPYKNRLYYMVTSTAHSPYTSVMPSVPIDTKQTAFRQLWLKQSQFKAKELNGTNSSKNMTNTNVNVNDNQHQNQNQNHSNDSTLSHSAKGNNNNNVNERSDSRTPPNTIGNAPPQHFVRQPRGSLSMKGVVMAATGGLANNMCTIPSTAECGKAFLDPFECINHQKTCTECDRRRRRMSNLNA